MQTDSTSPAIKAAFFHLLFSIALLTLSIVPPAQAADRDAEWKKVTEAMGKGLPKTAIEALEPIIQGALDDKAYGEAAKAIAQKIALEGAIQGNKPEEKITRLETAINTAPKEIVPILHTILANWYWHYFKQNKWRFMRRTTTDAPPGKDFTTWDLRRLFLEIDLKFRAALTHRPTLVGIPVAEFDELLKKGTMPDAYRPTLYDFIGHEALEFYTSGEQAGARAQDAFEFMANSPIFDNADSFLAWKAAEGTQAGESSEVHAINLYQDLMRLHQGEVEDDPTPYIHVDLERLRYGHNRAMGEEKNERYKAALERYVRRWADHENAAVALYYWGKVLQSEGHLVQARQKAIQGRNAHRESVGGRMCSNLISDIESKSSSARIERIWNRPLPVINVSYRNVTKVYFRAVRAEWSDYYKSKSGGPSYLSREDREALLKKDPALAWSVDLPPTTNYQQRTESIPAPETLAKGFYFLLVSHDESFAAKDNVVTYRDFWVSDLALVQRPRHGRMEGFVLNALSGEPVAGARIDVWHRDNQRRLVELPHVKTDELGFYSFPGKPDQRRYLIRVRHGQDALATANETYLYQPRPASPREQTVLFTDRALYRPGQTVQFKGICLRVDQEDNNYELLPGRVVTVVFSDANRKEIERLELRANDYGSISGSFTAPRDRLMGGMRIEVKAPRGSARFRVEEYKRPKFEVTLDAPKTAPKLDEQVSLQGTAEAYTGAPIDGAKVSFRVVREVRWPYWWSWYSWRRPSSSSRQEIAHGEIQTDAFGNFTIQFPAKPDRSIAPTNEPTFVYRINADVTDGSGETRSATRTVNVGYTALQAVLNADDWQVADKPVAVSITTSTLDGEPQTAEGSLKIHRLKAPDKVHRPSLGNHRDHRSQDGSNEPPPDMSDPRQWALGEVVKESGWTSDAEGKATLSVNLPVGVYRALLQTEDRFGKKVTARLPIQVVDPDQPRLGFKVPHLFKAPEWRAEPGEEFMALWGTGYEAGRAFVEIEHRNKLINRFWTNPDRTQQQITHAITEAMRGGFTVHLTQVRENRAHLHSRHVDVPWKNKELDVKWERFVSKLGPAQEETWTAVITGPDAERRAAEMAATLYDASLDQFVKHRWMERFSFFYRDRSSASPRFENSSQSLRSLHGRWGRSRLNQTMSFRSFPAEIAARVWSYGWAANKSRRMAAPAPMAMAADAEVRSASKQESENQPGEEKAVAAVAQEAESSPDLEKVSARKNLNETAFFFPQLLADKKGVVKLQFTMPEALTRWKFLGFIHDKELRSGFLEGETVTSKDLMIQPNPPRFLRERDELEFTVKVQNQSAARQTGKVRLTFSYATTGDAADADLGNTKNELSFDIPSKQSRSYSWRLKVPDNCGFLTYKAVGSTGRISDGEEGYLPVLSRRIFITESLPLPIRGAGQKTFEFTKLIQSDQSKSIQHVGLSVQMVSNPSWYAVLALPYLMEYPHQCTEQTFNRLYANALARTIANSDPKIRRIFDRWKNTPALESPLEKNQDLKAVMLEETPWYRDAKNESKARRNVGILFDDNRLNAETDKALRKLAEAQLNDGAWPWFPGGRGNDYITLYITTGFGRLRHLGADIPVTQAVKSLRRLDKWIHERYLRIQEIPDPEKHVPSRTICLYLYGRSFFLKDLPLKGDHKKAVDFFLQRARDHWLKVNSRQSQGHLALGLHRFNAFDKTRDDTPRDIMRSIKERSVTSEEMGRFWRETERSWWWYRAPIETQALMIEAFDEVMGDDDAVEECRVWLLKQKQTRDWKTTKATADAVYGLLLRGKDILASDALVELEVGGLNITPRIKGGGPVVEGRGPGNANTEVEAGTGFYEKRFDPAEIKGKFGRITVKKLDDGVAWGGVHWQFLQDMSEVTAHEGGPLKLKKALYTKVNTRKGPVLKEVKGPLAVGDQLVVRIELRVDRDMEYVHLKDQRGSGTEPVNVLSRYKYQDGLAYYESTRDTASHFYIDYLPKGIYVFEYATRIQHRGSYQTGMAQIQCMYAPEFNSHSQSHPLVVN